METRSLGEKVLGAYMSPVSSLYEKKGLVDVSHRLRMCEIAAQESDFIMVDTWEAEQPKWSKTFDVLQSVETRTKQRVIIVCGSDLIESFK